ncbi:aldose epimerase family protein [Rufibacter quisquiliarum]|uniref:Aldose 1-epimerase n=1 Tax=Rufibacter quisquiliarum TaxID=1549639 RepID=A0A839GKC6_9BACT|nr:aldose epimerase family protein [Rufibacter quisquiliarum]MBA9077249.1 aldose 1-epimerase [Rufibacter quisquiliarum]
MHIKRETFGKTKDGIEVQLYTLQNEKGMQVSVTNYGAIVTSVLAPDKDGKLEDVVLGFPSLDGYTNEAYQKSHPYFGAVVGRYGNRIAKGKFALNGKEYSLATNNAPNHLHGGNIGFDQVVWGVEELPEQNGVQFTYLSPDGEEGYPGTLLVSVTYSLTEENELVLTYKATTDQATPVNLTHHSYFNLTGEAEDILGHGLTLNADQYTVVNDTLIPTGELRNVTGTPFDFTTAHSIGERISQVEGGGYDHNFVLRKTEGALALAATVVEPQSGRIMEVFTTEPGVQFYSGNFLDGTLTGKKGQPITKRMGFCLETQHFPDSPNQPTFPNTVLEPGQVYRQTTVYKFSGK